MKIQTEPFWWSLFGAGGAISALFLPILLFLFGIAIPLGWVEPPTYERIHFLIAPFYIRIGLLAIVTLSLFHWAHRFRFTLYEGLQLHKFNRSIAVLCYGTAMIITGIAAYTLWNF